MNLSQCPVCSSKDFFKALEVKDHLVSRETFSISECRNCSLRFTNPRPNDKDLSKFYQSEDYISHTNEGNSMVNRLYKIARYFTLRSKRRLIQKNSSGRKLLDIGCGTGHFISHCAENNWDAFGVEPEEGARRIAAENDHLKLYADLLSIEEKNFDRITLWHVLEHLPNLNADLKRVVELMNKNAKLFIAVPNYLTYEEQKFSSAWAAYDVPRHLYHFTPKSIEELAVKHGLKLDNRYPMWLDSFYISLLSNKHKFGHSKFVNSFITGLLSNIYAIKSNNYSSIIYQFSKAR